MLFDLESGVAPLTQGVYDVCVCGTGPAGITVARELAATGKKVVLVEAGGFEYSERSQDVYAGLESGIPLYNTALTGCRLRYFGGTSNHWTGLCGVLEESDFWAKRYQELPGWPISRTEVLAHLKDASEILDLGTTDFSPRPFGDVKESAFERPTLVKSPPTRFGTKYRDEITRSQNIHLFINANLVNLRLADVASGVPRIEHVLVSNYRKEVARVSAKRYVLALGSVENARMLLNANRQAPNRIGNHSDFVGRCFMEHLNVQIGRFVTRSAQALIPSNGAISPTEQTVRRLNIGNGYLALHLNATPHESGRLGPVRGVFRRAACEFDTVKEFARKFKDFDCTGDGVITSLIEQTPDRNSRVTLAAQADEFGLKRPHLNWVLNDADRRTIRSLGFELAKNLLELDVARVQLSEFITDPRKNIEVWNHAHQMGTTRMAADPRYGVVDIDCRVHGVANMYIAGSSVFPTGGGVNPTFTIVMMSLRLARHLGTLA